ncbi:hypothetical protein FOFC_12306 [Fusarium oxysporum]|nr:hypothetical protein FOFC_12306 [Fusarium oxysporum]
MMYSYLAVSNILWRDTNTAASGLDFCIRGKARFQFLDDSRSP